MGYDLHITRATHWTETQDKEIHPSEWMDCVEIDPELELDPANGKYSVTWKGQCTVSEPWFDWSDGNVYTTNPDQAILGKMLQIASQLNATVQGDNGELYQRPEDLSGETS